jgi:cytochrome P450
VLLEAYVAHGPVFTLPLFHARYVFALGPEANHHILVANAANYRYREGHLGDLIPLLGDGLLTTDGAFHRHARTIMLPAFRHGHLAGLVAVIDEEVQRAVDRLTPGPLDLEHWTRRLALRIAMRALFGLDPDRASTGRDPARDFEVALRFFGRSPAGQMLRGPGSPWHRLQAARQRLDALILEEVVRRRSASEAGSDVLSLLIRAHDEQGTGLSDQQLRDQMMTILFAGHDTTTATVCFAAHELSRAPDVVDGLLRELDAHSAAVPFETLMGGGLPLMDQVLDEVLRLWPAAWVGPRKSIDDDVIAGVTVPGDVHVNYSSLASHRLPDVWEDPHRFDPERFSPERRATIPKGAYVPFGGGSRMCIGMRFGQLEIKMILAALLRRFEVQAHTSGGLATSQVPTMGPRHGLPVTLVAR